MNLSSSGSRRLAIRLKGDAAAHTRFFLYIKNSPPSFKLGIMSVIHFEFLMPLVIRRIAPRLRLRNRSRLSVPYIADADVKYATAVFVRHLRVQVAGGSMGHLHNHYCSPMSLLLAAAPVPPIRSNENLMST